MVLMLSISTQIEEKKFLFQESWDREVVWEVEWVSRINDCGYKTRWVEPLDKRGKKIERTQQTSDIGQAHQSRAPATHVI